MYGLDILSFISYALYRVLILNIFSERLTIILRSPMLQGPGGRQQFDNMLNVDTSEVSQLGFSLGQQSLNVLVQQRKTPNREC